ncbi:hypothetical protein D5018_01950 [Parashewanella curva]|uniref:Uncharacterized protein n=2 Tax=Parashewanella curva TaxID=2338552 RepID=A0A3L8Q1F8_9GAMM|nr:hypothetical protein D5018_01950 [Parashewanella curva]
MALNLQTIDGQWLDRGLPALYYRVMRLKEKMPEGTNAMTLTDSTISIPLLQQSNALVTEYLKHLNTYQDEVTLIHSYSNNRKESTLSEQGYALMHCHILKVLCNAIIVLEKLNIPLISLGFLKQYFTQDASLEITEQQDELVSYYQSQTLHDYLATRIELFDLFSDAVLPFESGPKEYYLFRYELFGYFIESTSVLLSTLEAVYVDIHSQLPQVKESISKLNIVDRTDKYMLAVKYQASPKYAGYISSSLKFCQYLREPDSACFLLDSLFILDKLYPTDKLPTTEIQQVLHSIQFLLTSLPIDLSTVKVLSSTPWVPFLACLFKLDTKEWFHSELISPEHRALSQQVFLLKSALHNRYCSVKKKGHNALPPHLRKCQYTFTPTETSLDPPSVFISRAFIPTITGETSIEYDNSDLALFSQTQFLKVFALPAFKLRTESDEITMEVYSLASIKQLNELYKAYLTFAPPKGKTLETHLKERFTQESTKAKASKSKLEGTAWFQRAQQLVQAYETYLSAHDNQLALIILQRISQSDDSKSEAFNVQFAHFALRDFCYFFKKAVFEHFNHFQRLRVHCDLIHDQLTSPPLELAKAVNGLTNSIKGMQKAMIELNRCRLLLGTVTDEDFIDGSHSILLNEVCSHFLTGWHRSIECFEKLKFTQVELKASEEFEELRKVVFEGAFYENRGLIFNIWTLCTIPKTMEILSVLYSIEIITCPSKIPNSLRGLDNLPISRQLFGLKTVMSTLAQHLINATATNSPDYKPLFESVLKSFKNGWLKNTWFLAVTFNEAMLKEENNPLLLAKKYLATEAELSERARLSRQKTQKQIDLEVQQQLQRFSKKEREPEDTTTQQPVSKKEKRRKKQQRRTLLAVSMQRQSSSLSSTKSSASDTQTQHYSSAHTVPPSPAILEIEKAERGIKHPSFATIARLHFLLNKYRYDFDLSLRLRHDLIEASSQLMAPAITAIKAMKPNAQCLLEMLQNSISSPPYVFTKPRVYTSMLLDLKNIPTNCLKVETGLRVFCTHAEEVKQAQIPEDSEIHEFFLDQIEKVEQDLAVFRATLLTLQAALECRREVLDLRRNYKTYTNPPLHKQLRGKSYSEKPRENEHICSEAYLSIDRVGKQVLLFEDMASSNEF